MAVNLNSKVNGNYSSFDAFKSRVTGNNQTTVQPKQEVSQPKPEPVQVETKPDEIIVDQSKVDDNLKEKNENKEVVYVEKKQKRSIWDKFRGFWAGIQKFGISTVEYTKGLAKGVYYGSMAAVGVLALDAAIGGVKIVQKSRKGPIPEGLKVLSKKGKWGAAISSAAVVGYNLFQAYLNANEKNAKIDHRWQTGHDAE